jgi:DNA helicase-2/ATP-dependent DNA helicase PcrA
VGDPDQSIYSWRNADIRNILSFQRDYPDAGIVTLEENYRSTETILEAAHSVISANRKRMDKPLVTQNQRGKPVFIGEAFNPEEEAQQVLREIQRLKREEGHSLGDCAVMYRVNAQSRALEEGCLQYGISYKLIGGLRFYQRKEVKDVVAYLRIINNTYDEVSLSRVINIPPRGIGQRTVEQLTQIARDGDIALYSAMQLAVDKNNEPLGGQTLDTRASQAVTRFLRIINSLIEEGKSLGVAELIDAIVDHIGYRSFLMEDGEQGHERWENVQELRSTALRFQDIDPEDRLSEFLQSVTLVSDMDTQEEDQDSITLITLHQAKGLEFPLVFLVGLEEGLLPHIRSFDDPDQIEEERRLFYVGMTRAKERLYITRAFRRGFWGKSGANMPSRFLSDIPKNLVSPMGKPERRVSSAVQPIFRRSNLPAEEITSVPLKTGERVRHPKFGEGIVVSCITSGQDHQVTVAFKGESGIKKLLLGYAGLKVVG